MASMDSNQGMGRRLRISLVRRQVVRGFFNSHPEHCFRFDRSPPAKMPTEKSITILKSDTFRSFWALPSGYD
jgi:hypothetical protein